MGRKSDAKERLLDAAQQLIWERSYGTVTIDNICEQAKVQKGSFYYFFKSKEELAAASIKADWETCSKEDWDKAFSPVNPPLQRIRNILQLAYDKQVELKEEHGVVLGCPCFSLGSEISTQNEPIRQQIQEILGLQVKYFESAIREAQAEGTLPPGDATAKAKFLYALFEGCQAQARIHNDLEYLRTLPDIALQLLGAKDLQTV
jgi:TetR/AcrR family transcriptional repressor of nem operon